jgi:hypothetical protein
MVISLNTPERELYDQQRGTDMPFEAYLAGIEAMIAEVARRGPPPATRVNVLFEGAKAEDPVERERVRGLVRRWAEVARGANGATPEGVEEAFRLDPAGTTLFPLCRGLELQFTPYHAWGAAPPPPPSNHFCSYPWRQLAVLVDGKATACCVDAEGEIVLGDANVESVERIWNGPEMNRLREGFLRKRAVHRKCATCSVADRREDFFPGLSSEGAGPETSGLAPPSAGVSAGAA